MTRKGIVAIAVLFLVAFVILALGRRGYEEIEAFQSLEKAAAKLRQEFPSVKRLSPRSLAPILESPEPVVLIDAREPEEYAVSHLPGAVNLGTVKELEDHLATRTVAPEVLAVYGAIGFRAAKLAEQLRTSGFGNVELLEGGIFRWANENRPLVDPSGAAATQVHPYNKIYRRLLDPEKRVPSSEEDR